MAVTAPPTAPPPRKYNPGFLSDDELVASFCVRTSEFASIVEVLRECTGSANPHQIVIGPRGSGKTSLLLRVAAEVRRDAALSSGFFPVVFAEESYEVGTAGELWLECLSRLADQAPRREGGPDLHRTFEDLRTVRDDRTLGERCLAALLDFSDREGRRLVLMVENLNMLFRDMADSREAGWRLRQTLQTEPRIVLLASATSRFDEIDHPDHALYDLFRVLALRPLNTSECAVLWNRVSRQRQRRPPETIRSLEILTGGSPRLLAIVARFGARRSFRELMVELLDLVDDHTEYFKSHLDSLPSQERRVYLALADLWKPAFTREIADRARLSTSKCSAQLARLIERDAVLVAGGSARRKQYYLSERLYNIYYLLRRRRPDRLIEALIRFMASYYSPRELVDRGVRIAHEAEGLDPVMRSLHRSAFARLVELPALARYREELRTMAPAGFAEIFHRISVPSDEAGTATPGIGQDHRSAARRHGATAASPEVTATRTLFGEAVALWNQNRAQDALAAFDEVVSRFGESEAPALLEQVAVALVGKGVILDRLHRPEEALSACDEVVSRFGESGTPALLEQVAMALVKKGVTLGGLHRLEEALSACDEVVGRFGESETSALLEQVAIALVYKWVTLGRLNRPEEALSACDEVVGRFGESETSALLEQVAIALVYKGAILGGLHRLEEALSACDEVVGRFGESETPALLEQVAKALVYKGVTLGGLERPEEELSAYDEVVNRFGESETPALLEQVAKALVNKGVTLGGLHRLEEALSACDEVVNRFGESKAPALLEQVAKALVYKGVTLGGLHRPEEELSAYDEVVGRFGESETPALLEQVAKALVYKWVTLGGLERPEEALSACDEVVSRFGKSEAPALLEQVAKALVYKGVTLVGGLERPVEALSACDEVVSRFGESEAPALLEQVAKALVNKGVTLGGLHRPEEELSTYDEVVSRFGESEAPALLEQVAEALVNKGATLGGLHRPEEALTIWDEVVSRFGGSKSSALRGWTEIALLGKAVLELKGRRYEAAIETAGRVLDQPFTESPANRWRGHLIRARAILASGDPSGSGQDIEAMLAILPELDSLPSAVLHALMEFSVGLGPARMRELIRASPAADLLLPLTTALEWELGLAPRVAREVEEVARDIRRDLAKRRDAGSDVGSV